MKYSIEKGNKKEIKKEPQDKNYTPKQRVARTKKHRKNKERLGTKNAPKNKERIGGKLQ